MSSHFFADHPSHPLCFCQATNLLKVDGPVDMVKNQWVNEWEIFQYQRTSAQNHRILCTPPSSLTNSSPKKGRTFNRKYIPNSQVSPTCPLKPSMVGVDVCFSRRWWWEVKVKQYHDIQDTSYLFMELKSGDANETIRSWKTSFGFGYPSHQLFERKIKGRFLEFLLNNLFVPPGRPCQKIVQSTVQYDVGFLMNDTSSFYTYVCLYSKISIFYTQLL